MGEYVCWRSRLNIVSQDEKRTKRRQSWPQSNTFEDRPIMSPTPSGCQAIPFHFAAHDSAKTTAFETPNSSSSISWKYAANTYDVFLTENLHKLHLTKRMKYNNPDLIIQDSCMELNLSMRITSTDHFLQLSMTIR